MIKKIVRILFTYKFLTLFPLFFNLILLILFKEAEMSIYTTEVTKLLDQEAEKIKSNEFFFSAYFPAKHYSKLQLRKRLKSLALTTFRKHKNLKNFSRLHRRLVEKITYQINRLKELEKGLAIFVKFNARKQQKGRLDEILDKNVTIIPLAREPKKEAYIGKTFDLDQLVWIDKTAIDALILNLGRQTCDFYTLEGADFSKYTQLKNKFIKEKEGEYLEKFAPLPKQGTYYSTGSDKTARTELKENSKFVSQIKQYLKTNRGFQVRFDYLIVFYSANFAGLIKAFERDIKTIFSSFTPIFVAKNIQNENQVKEEAISQIKKFQKTVKKDLLKLAKEDFNTCAPGWNKVVRADRLKKIDTLFIRPTVKKKGYLLNKEFIYTYPIKDSRMVRNIAPWLVRNVVNASGRIVVIKDGSIMPGEEVAAKLRY